MTPYAANIAIEFAGARINPGDYLYVDPAGGVVIPASTVDDVLTEAARVEAQDAAFLVQIGSEDRHR